MKQFLLIGGLSLVSMTSFSQQQVSNARRIMEPQTPVEITINKEQASDSIVVSSNGKRIEQLLVEPVSKETVPVSTAQQQQPILNSTKKKP